MWYLSRADTHVRLCLAVKTVFFMRLNCSAAPRRVFFKLQPGIILYPPPPFYNSVHIIAPSLYFSLRSLNGSLPTNVEIKNNTLFFKGPVTYDLAGTYVCDATNGIGTRTGIVDVNITGKVERLFSVSPSPRFLAWLASIQHHPLEILSGTVRPPAYAGKQKYPCTCTDRLIAADCLRVLEAASTCPGCAASPRPPAAVCCRLDGGEERKKKACPCAYRRTTRTTSTQRRPTPSPCYTSCA